VGSQFQMWACAHVRPPFGPFPSSLLNQNRSLKCGHVAFKRWHTLFKCGHVIFKRWHMLFQRGHVILKCGHVISIAGTAKERSGKLLLAE